MSEAPNTAQAAADLEELLTSEFTKLDNNPPDSLYHYTDSGGLLGILNTKSLWFSQAGFLNDSAEISYADALVKSALTGKLQSTNNPGLRKLLQSTLDSMKLFTSVNVAFYIACFCEKGDLLSQWRGYGALGGGFAIGFRSADLEACLKSTEKASGLAKVIYNKDQQLTYISRAIDEFCQLVEQWQGSGWEPEKDGSLDIARRHLRMALSEPYLRFKHPSFEEEHEWRLMVFRSPNGKDLKFRPSASRIVPFLQIDMRTSNADKKENLPISRVICGPTQHQEIAAQSLALRLAQDFPHGGIKIDVSSVPLRS